LSVNRTTANRHVAHCWLNCSSATATRPWCWLYAGGWYGWNQMNGRSRSHGGYRSADRARSLLWVVASRLATSAAVHALAPWRLFVLRRLVGEACAAELWRPAPPGRWRPPTRGRRGRARSSPTAVRRATRPRSRPSPGGRAAGQLDLFGGVPDAGGRDAASSWGRDHGHGGGALRTTGRLAPGRMPRRGEGDSRCFLRRWGQTAAGPPPPSGGRDGLRRVP
jgi:hypothetical protein